MVDVDFATQFYNLEGDLISERKRNFRKLLRSKCSLDDGELKNVRPRTYLESLLYIDMLIYFKKTARLLQILKEGNEVFINKILKQTWFFQDIFKDMSTKDLVNEFLPCTSFTTRMKILKKLSVVFDESRMDEVFDCVDERYGFYIAKNILHTCSGNKIEKLLSIREICLQPKQVKAIFNKNPELFVIYLKHYKQVKRKIYYNENVYKYVAGKNIKLWLHLKETGNIITQKLGRRIGRKVVDIKKPDVIKNVRMYTDFLRKDVVVRRLQGDFKDVYFELFPRMKGDMHHVNYCNELFVHYPKKRQWELFSETFSKVFNQSILNNLLHVTSNYLKLFPSRDIRIKWAEVHYNADNKNDLLKYFDPNKAIPMIKEKINVTSDINDRTNLVMLLLENCAENNDLKSLEEVLKYICYRHRNEETAFRYKLLSRIEQLFTLKNLNEHHWRYVNEQVTFLKFRNEFNYRVHFDFLQRYLEYLFINGKPFKDELTQYIDEVLLENLRFRVNFKHPQFERKILVHISDVLTKVGVNYDNHQKRLIVDIIEFNIEYPEYFIDIRNISNLTSCVHSIFDKAVEDLIDIEQEVIQEILLYNLEYPENAVRIVNNKIMEIFTNTKDKFWLHRVLGAMVKKRNRSEFENEVFKFFWDNLVCVDDMSLDIFSWYFANEPQALLPHLEVILEYNLSRWCLDIVTWCLYNQPRALVPFFDDILEENLYKRSVYFKPSDIKLMSHLSFDTRLIEMYVNELGITVKEETGVHVKENVTVFDYWDEVDYSIREKAVNILSKVMSTDDFIKTVAQRFLPVKEKVDVLDAKVMKVYKMQCEVAKSLKNLPEPVKVLPTVLKFSLGDYLQSGLTSLYSIFYRSPEKSLPTYINMLSNRAVSARKHSIFLSCELLSFNYAVGMLKTGKRNSISGEKHLFAAALKYFLKNPSEDLLNLVTSNLSSIDKNDEETLHTVVHVDIPRRYRKIYLENCWTFFESMKDKEIDITSYLNSLMNRFCSPDVVILLSREFCVHIISNYFRDSIECLYEINEFVIGCLRYREAEQDENFKLFFDIITIFKRKKDDDTKKEIANVFYLFHEMALKILIDESRDAVGIKFIKLFEQGWTKLFLPMEMFDEYVMLSLVIAKCEAQDPFIENYAQNVVTFMEKLISEYGPLIFNKFQIYLTRSLIFPKDEDEYLFIYTLLKINTTAFTCILVLDLLQRFSHTGRSEETTRCYDNTLEILKSITDPIVVLYYNWYLDRLKA